MIDRDRDGRSDGSLRSIRPPRCPLFAGPGSARLSLGGPGKRSDTPAGRGRRDARDLEPGRDGGERGPDEPEHDDDGRDARDDLDGARLHAAESSWAGPWSPLPGRSARRSAGARPSRSSRPRAGVPSRTCSRWSRHSCQPAASRAALPISSKRLIKVSTHPPSPAETSRRRVSSPSQINSMAEGGVNSTIRPVNRRPRPRGRRTATQRRSRAGPRCRTGTRRRGWTAR